MFSGRDRGSNSKAVLKLCVNNMNQGVYHLKMNVLK